LGGWVDEAGLSGKNTINLLDLARFEWVRVMMRPLREALFLPPNHPVANSGTESAGINRHIVGDGKALRKRRSDSIPASSLACDLARDGSEA
jgi:hypothetical protein